MRRSFSEEGNEDLYSQSEGNRTDGGDKLCYSNEDLDSCVDSISVDDSWFQTDKNAPDSAPVISFVDRWEMWLSQSANSKENCVTFEWFLNDNTGNYHNTMVYSLKHCDSCETYFTKQYNFQQHLKLCRVYPMCKFCKRSFSNRGELQRHIAVSQHKVVTKEDWRRVSQAEYIRLCREGRVYTSEYLSVKQHLNRRENKLNWQGKGKAILKSQNNLSSKHPVDAVSKFCSGTVESRKKASNSSSVDWERAPTEGLFCNTSKTYNTQAHVLPFPDALEEEFKKSSQEKFVTDDLSRVDTNNIQADECNNNGPNKTEKANMTTKSLHTLFYCQMCNTYFIYLKTFKRHRGKCSGKNICKVCFQNFKNFRLLLNHIRKEKHAVQQDTTHISASHKTFQKLLKAKSIAACDVLEYQEKAKENLTKQMSGKKEVEGTLSTTPVTEACVGQTSVAGKMPKEMIASGKYDGTIIHEKENSSKEKSEMVGKECTSKDSSVSLPGEEQIIKNIKVIGKETCTALEDNQKLVDGASNSKGEFPVTRYETVNDHVKQTPVSPSDSGCQMDDICHDIDSPFIGLDIKEELLEESVNTSYFQAVDGREMVEAVNDITIKGERETCSTLTGEKLKRKESYKPLPKSVKIARLEHKTSSLSKYLEVQKHPERQVHCIKLRRRTEYCPGCMESVDVRSAILNTETFEVSMWCKTCAWSILFTDFFHPQ